LVQGFDNPLTLNPDASEIRVEELMQVSQSHEMSLALPGV
jgi:hypothetical protein